MELDFALTGTDQATATALVAGFQRRCPIFGSMFVATAETVSRVTVR
jgi:hypothetical protein